MSPADEIFDTTLTTAIRSLLAKEPITEATSESIQMDDCQEAMIIVTERIDVPLRQVDTVAEMALEPIQIDLRDKSTEPLVPQGIIIDTLHEMYPSSTARWCQPRLNPFPAIDFWSSFAKACREEDLDNVDDQPRASLLQDAISFLC